MNIYIYIHMHMIWSRYAWSMNSNWGIYVHQLILPRLEFWSGVDELVNKLFWLLGILGSTESGAGLFCPAVDPSWLATDVLCDRKVRSVCDGLGGTWRCDFAGGLSISTTGSGTFRPPRPFTSTPSPALWRPSIEVEIEQRDESVERERRAMAVLAWLWSKFLRVKYEWMKWEGIIPLYRHRGRKL